MKQALVIVSFGTSVEKASLDIHAVEKALSDAIPDADVFMAYTSSIIRRILAKRGTPVPSLGEVLEDMEADYDRVIVQPTHILCGIEYDKIKAVADSYNYKFRELLFGKPLLGDAEDLKELSGVLMARYGKEDRALVLMGHGSESFSNMVYPAFQTVMRYMGCKNAYVGTVEGWPEIDDVIAQLKDAGEKSAILVPLMLVAGDHAINDMSGDEDDSWKKLIEKEGISVSCHLDGLGLLPEVQALYCRHLREIIGE